MGKRERRAATGEEQTSGSWMITFSDLATLLLTFFVLLLSMSTMDDLKLRSAFHNFTSSSGILRFKEYGEIYRPKEILIEGLYEKLKDALIVKKDRDSLEDDIPSDIIESPLESASGSLVFQDVEGGFKLTFGQDLLFVSGSAEIKDEAKPVLGQIAKFIRISHHQIYLDGHTDNVPIHNEVYSSNADLSLARAYNVLAYFVGEENLPSDTIAIAGYGEVLPVLSNDTSEGRTKNRRVEIIFKNQKYF